MNEENKKLENVKKSCKAASIFSKVIFWLLAVSAVLTLISGIVVIANQEKINKLTDQEQPKLDRSLTLFHIVTIDEKDVKLLENSELTSSVPLIQELLDRHPDSYGLIMGVYLIAVSLICVVLAVSMYLISSVLDIIVKEGNSFADKVPKRLLTSMIIISVVVGSSVGIGFGVFAGFITWALYAIVDYGRVLRVQSDETL